MLAMAVLPDGLEMGDIDSWLSSIQSVQRTLQASEIALEAVDERGVVVVGQLRLFAESQQLQGVRTVGRGLGKPPSELLSCRCGALHVLVGEWRVMQMLAQRARISVPWADMSASGFRKGLLVLSWR